MKKVLIKNIIHNLVINVQPKIQSKNVIIKLVNKFFFISLAKFHSSLFPIYPNFKKKGILYLNSAYNSFLLLSKELRLNNINAFSVDLVSPDNYREFFFSRHDINLHYVFKNKNLYNFYKLSHYFEIKKKFSIIHFTGMYGLERSINLYPNTLAQEFDFEKLFKKSGIKMIYTCTGCNDAIKQNEWLSHTKGMCFYCIHKDNHEVCSDDNNYKWKLYLEKYIDLIYLEMLPVFNEFKTKCIYNSRTVVSEAAAKTEKIPKQFLINKKNKIVFLHFLGNSHLRLKSDNDPKGTKFIIKTFQNLEKKYKNEIVFKYITNLKRENIKYYFSQADVLVDQLYAGCYGSITREAMAYGLVIMSNLIFKNKENSVINQLKKSPIINVNKSNLEKKIIFIIQNKSEINILKKKSYKYWKNNYYAKNTVKKLLNDYNQLLDQKNKLF